MKKHWKKILLLFGVLLLAVGGYILYLFEFKEYDTADEEVEKITSESYKVELPDGTLLEFDEEGNAIDHAGDKSSSSANANSKKDSNVIQAQTNDQASNNPSNSSGGKHSIKNPKSSASSEKGSSGSKTDTKSNKVTVASIKEKYNPVIVSLQNQADSKINALASRAMNEYQLKKAKGEAVDYAYFYTKYTEAASALEGQTDSVFYNVISILEKELEKNGYSKSHAKSFIDQYENAKEERRDSMLKKAMNR